jgi:hypothetical protein
MIHRNGCRIGIEGGREQVEVMRARSTEHSQ